MSAKKLAYRTWYQGKRRFLARAARLGAVRVSGMSRPAEPMADRLPLGLFMPSAEIETIGDGFAFTFLNHREEFTLPIDWHRKELQTGTRLWLLNLHYMEYLPALSDADFETIARDWIKGNPRYAPAYWTYNWNCYSLSLRVVSLMKEIARRRERLSGDLLETLGRSLSNQIAFLERNLEEDIGGNHIMKNIKALAWGSGFFEGARADRWRTLAVKLLDREITEQILADGVHYERSPSYHAAVFADLLETRHVLGPGILEGRLDEALRRMAQPLADLAHPDGTPALFNDAGLTMSHSPSACLGAYRSVTGEEVTRQEQFYYPDAGYFGLDAGGYYLVADMGPIGPDDLPAHAHGDIGSFELSVDGERMIVDPGVFEYSPGPRRSRSRTAASHNVLHIQGGDQAEFFGAFRCGRRPHVSSTFSATTDGFVLEGSHDGYANLPGAPTVRRRIEASVGGFTVEDWLSGPAASSASVSYLLHPQAVPSFHAEGILVRRGDAAILVTATHPITIEEDVWWPDMGQELRTSRLRLTLSSQCCEARCRFRIRTGTILETD